MNIFSGMLGVEEAVAITAGRKCGRQGDYLAWEDAELTLTHPEFIHIGEVDQNELCNFNPIPRYIKKLSIGLTFSRQVPIQPEAGPPGGRIWLHQVPRQLSLRSKKPGGLQ